MAFQTGTATSHTDFYAQLISFLTTNADLVSAGQAWTQVWQAAGTDPNPEDRMLRGPGLTGTDEVYVGIRLDSNVAQDGYWMELRGATGFLATAAQYSEHVNSTPHAVRMFLDSGNMQYWFVANGRRFVCVVKISTVFQSCYAGFYLPFAPPTAYPYPMFIGGTSGPVDADGAESWRSEDDNHRMFFNSNYDTSPTDDQEPGAWLLDGGGQWLRVANNGNPEDANCTMAPRRTYGDFFTTDNDDSDFRNESYNRWELFARIMDCYGGDRVLLPLQPVQHNPVGQLFGQLDGVYKVQGVANAAENLITFNSIDHLVVPDVFRSNFEDYMAVGLG